MAKKLIVMEFNELCPSLISKFIDQGRLPNFKKLRELSKTYITDANVEGEALNPWVQWVSVHTGLKADEHKVFRLNEIKNFKGNFTWDELSAQGLKCWICGSMNAAHGAKFNGELVPDPWSEDILPHPSNEFEPYFEFVQSAVIGHSRNEKASPSSFIKFMTGNGLRFGTFVKLALQIIREKFDPSISWKRAMLLDQIQFDLFKHRFQKNNPEFSTFFSNSTAHYQHHYWKDFEPEKFSETTPDEKKKNAVLSGYQNADDLIGKAMKLGGSETALVFCTALSQQPFTEKARFYYNINSKAALFEKFNIPGHVKLKPVMAEQFHLECESEDEAINLENHLQGFHMEHDHYFHEGSRQVFLTSREGTIVHAQCRCTKEVEAESKIINTKTQETMPFYDAFFQMDDVKSGHHHPDGLYWFYDPASAKEAGKNERIELERIHFDILRYFEYQAS